MIIHSSLKSLLQSLGYVCIPGALLLYILQHRYNIQSNLAKEVLDRLDILIQDMLDWHTNFFLNENKCEKLNKAQAISKQLKQLKQKSTLLQNSEIQKAFEQLMELMDRLVLSLNMLYFAEENPEKELTLRSQDLFYSCSQEKFSSQYAILQKNLQEFIMLKKNPIIIYLKKIIRKFFISC